MLSVDLFTRQVAPSDMTESATIALSNYSVSVPIVGFLTGIVFMMYLPYIHGARDEPILLKVVASVVTLANIVDFSLSIVGLQKYAVDAMKSPASALRILSIGIGQAITSFTSSILVQLYFAYVVYKATGSSVVWLAVAGVLIAVSLADGISTAYIYYSLVTEGVPGADSSRGKIFAISNLVGACTVAAFNMLVTIVLCSVFFSGKRKAVFGNTMDITTRLLTTTLETFFLVTAAAVAGIVLVVITLCQTGLPALRARMGIVTDMSVMSRLYAISLLYTLTRRASLREFSGSIQGDSFPRETRLSHLRIRKPALRNGGRSKATISLSDGVRIQKDVECTSDEVEVGSFGKKTRLSSNRHSLKYAAYKLEGHPFQQVKPGW